ncbi:MAG: hypothetical protein U0K93_04210 [Acutalibacteraceae bacterium]|nr:hypothetical protein [Acutalibacteraceae bacterium]
MPLTKNPVYIHEPTDLQCGQAVLAMLSDKTVPEIIELVSTDRETTLKQMFYALDCCGIAYNKERKAVSEKEELPKICFLSLETPHCWHWSLYYDGVFYDPEYGVLEEFPPSARRYYWEIISN